MDWSWLEKLNSRNIPEKVIGKYNDGTPYEERSYDWEHEVVIGKKVLAKFPEEEKKKWYRNSVMHPNLFNEEWWFYQNMKEKIEKGNWTGDSVFFNVEELLWFFGKPPSKQPIYIRGFKNFTDLDLKKFYELAITSKKNPLQHHQVRIRHKVLERNERGDVLDSNAPNPEFRKYLIARKETLLDENYKVIYSVPDEENREYETIADDEKEAKKEKHRQDCQKISYLLIPLRSQGMSLRGICNTLNTSGMTTERGTKFHPS
jgi:hypothetical protein